MTDDIRIKTKIAIGQKDFDILKEKGLIFFGINCDNRDIKIDNEVSYYISDELYLILFRIKGKKKMTVSEIENELGYKIEIISR